MRQNLANAIVPLGKYDPFPLIAGNLAHNQPVNKSEVSLQLGCSIAICVVSSTKMPFTALWQLIGNPSNLVCLSTV